MQMRRALVGEFPLFERLIKSNMTVAELMIASDVMQDHYSEPKKRYAIVSAIRCDQSVLGVIGYYISFPVQSAPGFWPGDLVLVTIKERPLRQMIDKF